MPNAKIGKVNLSDTINTQRLRFNQLIDSVGSVSLSSVNQTAGRNTFTGSYPTVGEALKEHEARLDSADIIEVKTPRIRAFDNTYDNTLAGDVYMQSDVDISGNLQLDGNLQVDGTLTVDGVVTMKAGSSGSVTLGDDNTDNVVFDADVNSSIIPNTDDAFDLGNSLQEWRHLYVDGTGYIDEISADSATIGTMKVTDLTDNRIVIAGTSGELEDDANFTWDGDIFNVEGITTLDSTTVDGPLEVTGNTDLDGTLTVDGITTMNSNLVLDTNDINDVTNVYLKDAIIHSGDDDTKINFGNNTIDLETGGVARIAITDTNVTISEDLTVEDSAYITGNLAIGGNVQIDGTLTVDGVVNMKAGSSGTVTLGDDDTDNVVFDADINSNIIPNTTNEFDLGSSAKEWKHGYFDGTVHADNLAADSATITGDLDVQGITTLDSTTVDGTLDVTSNLNVDNNLNVNGITTLDSTTVDGTLHITGAVTSDGTAFAIAAGTGTDDPVTLGDTINFQGGQSITTTVSNNNIKIDGDFATTTSKGVAQFSSDNFSVTNGVVTIKDDGVALGTETTGNYMSGISGTANEITVSHTPGEGSSATISLPDDVTIGQDLGVTRNLNVTGTFSVGGVTTFTGGTRFATSHNVMLDGVAVNNVNRGGIAIDRPSSDSAVLQWNELGDYWEAGTTNSVYRLALQNDSAAFSNIYQTGTGATRIPAGTTDQRPTAAQGQIRYNTSNNSFEGYSGASWGSLGGLIDQDQDTYIISEISSGTDSDTLQFYASGTKIATANSTNLTALKDFYVEGFSYLDSAIVDGDLEVSGNLTVSGTATYVNTETVELADNFILLNSNATGAPADVTNVGIEINRGTSTNTQLRWNELGDYWTVGEGNDPSYSRIATSDWLNAGGGLSYNNSTGEFAHSNTSSQLSVNKSGNTFIQDITLDAYGHITNIGTNSVTVGNATISLAAGSDLHFDEADKTFTTNQSTDQTLTIDHDDITRTNATSTAGPAFGGTFTAIDSLTSNARGHVTAVNTKTVTIPSLPTYDNYQYWTIKDSAETSLNVSTTDTIEFLGKVGMDVVLDTTGDNGKLNITNIDRGSSQNIFKNIAVLNSESTTLHTAVADTNDDTFNIKQGNAGITLGGAGEDDNVIISHYTPDNVPSDVTSTARTYVKSISFDDFGHVTAVATGTESVVNTNQKTQWYLEDNSGTEKTIKHNTEVKFVNDGGVSAEWDGGTGTNNNPYDLDLKITTSVIAGAGLSGGGVLSSSRTVNVGAGTGVIVNDDDVAIGQAIGKDDHPEFVDIDLYDVHAEDGVGVVNFSQQTRNNVHRPVFLNIVNNDTVATTDGHIIGGIQFLAEDDETTAIGNLESLPKYAAIDAGYNSPDHDSRSGYIKMYVASNASGGGVNMSVFDAEGGTGGDTIVRGFDGTYIRAQNEIRLTTSNTSTNPVNTGDIFLEPEGRTVHFRGTGLESAAIKMQLDNSSQSLSSTDELTIAAANTSGTSGSLNLDASTYVRIRPDQGKVFFNDGGAAGSQIEFNLTSSSQQIQASDVLYIKSGASDSIVYEAGNDANQGTHKFRGDRIEIQDYLGYSGGFLKFGERNTSLGFTHPAYSRHLEIGAQSQGAEITVYEAGVAITNSLYVGREQPSTLPDNEIRAEGDITAFYASDIRLKENIKVIPNAIDKIKSIRGVEFDWTDEHLESRGGVDGYFAKKHDVGVIAQEVEKVLPEVVGERKDGTLAVEYQKMVALLIEGMKEQQEQINLLKQEIKNLRNK